MSPNPAPNPSKVTHHPSKPLFLDQWEAPCRNCGRFGTIPNSMITDVFNNTFCSADCGWSHLFRPSQKERDAAAAGAHLTGAAPRPRRQSSRRSSRSSKNAPQVTEEQLRRRQYDEMVVRRQRANLAAARKRIEQKCMESAKKSEKKDKPRKLEAWEVAKSRCTYSGNAMFDYMKMEM